MTKRVTASYSGWVHGVGFRYTACRLARNLNLTGYVKNLVDGRVELVAEGEEEKLKMLLSKINDMMKGYIKDQRVTWEPASSSFNGFDIRF